MKYCNFVWKFKGY